MDAKDKRLAEAALRRLCRRAQIDGIRFGPILQVLITDHASDKLVIRGQVYLNLGSNWTVFNTLPTPLPDCEEDLPQTSEEQQLGLLCSLRGAVITDVELGAQQPHLFIHLQGGRVLFINGRHDQYECWNAGIAFGSAQDFWLVVATPGGGVSVWTPDNFNPIDV